MGKGRKVAQLLMSTRTCQTCGKELKQKRYAVNVRNAHGNLEDRAHFNRRRYCNRRCLVQSQPPPHPNGVAHPCWKGGIVKTRTKRGTYLLEKCPTHPRAHKITGYVLQHILIAEKSLKRALPRQACVHHADGDGTNNTQRNLVICENNAYHKLLHVRIRQQKHLKAEQETTTAV
jgi:hypothetical protein